MIFLLEGLWEERVLVRKVDVLYVVVRGGVVDGGSQGGMRANGRGVGIAKEKRDVKKQFKFYTIDSMTFPGF